MKRQTIYPMLIAVLAAVLLTQVHAQTRDNSVSEARIRRLLSPEDTENKAIQFSAGAVSREQALPINPKHEVSPNSPQELRALIFENYTPLGTGGAALSGGAAPQVARSSGVVKLPSDSPAEETTKSGETAPPAQKPPTQGDAKEAQ